VRLSFIGAQQRYGRAGGHWSIASLFVGVEAMELVASSEVVAIGSGFEWFAIFISFSGDQGWRALLAQARQQTTAGFYCNWVFETLAEPASTFLVGGRNPQAVLILPHAQEDQLRGKGGFSRRSEP